MLNVCSHLLLYICEIFKFLMEQLTIMQAVIWFLARWSRTYLMASEASGNGDGGYLPEQLQHSKKVLLDFFGELNKGKSVLDLIVRISITALISYPGEKDLQVLKGLLLP